MLKKNVKLLFFFLILFSLVPIIVNATSGCCSHHGGVDCSRKQSDGTVICNDGWTGSSCSYSSMVKCNSYSSNNNNSDSDSGYSNEEKSDNTIYWLIGGGIVLYWGHSYFKNKKDNTKNPINYVNPQKNYSNINNNYISNEESNKHELIRNAINGNLNILIKYESMKKSVTTREVMPKEIYKEHNQYYLRAFCLLRQEERVFKISRIIKIEVVKNENIDKK